MKSRTVLVVDDDLDSRDLITETLLEAGLRVFCVSSGPRAIEILLHTRPDVVVLDVMMPYIGGFDVLDAMRRIPGCERVPVILETANPSRENGRRAVESGVTYMLAKPLDLAMLVRAVMNTIRQSRAAARANLHEACGSGVQGRPSGPPTRFD